MFKIDQLLKVNSKSNLFCLYDYRISIRTRQGRKSPLTEPTINSYVKLGKTNKPRLRMRKLG